MAEEKEFYVHILNWPVSAKSPEEAAKETLRDIRDGERPVFIVTEEVALLRPLYKVTFEEFDSELWREEEEEEEEQDEKTDD